MNTQLKNFDIRMACRDDLPRLDRFVTDLRIAKSVDYFMLQYEMQEAGRRIVFLAELDSELVGYCILNWHPKYAFFKKMGLPEVQDLNVAREHRRQGIATQMILKCEGLAREKGLSHMGIGVGMDASFGAAQRLYIKLGYVPDGHGITYDRQYVGQGEFRPVDGELCLMMVKDLQKQKDVLNPA